MISLISSLAAVLLCTAACGDDRGDRLPDWEWGDKNEGVDDNADKPFYIWIDAAANFPDFANSKENIKRDLTKAKEAGFTDVVVDVRPTTGDVLFRSEQGTPVQYLGAWTSEGYTKIERTAEWDYLEAFIQAGHELGLKVHAAINTMVGGRKTSIGSAGPVFSDPAKQAWVCTYNLKSGLTSAMNAGEDTYFFNPALPEVQAYLISLVRDLAKYEGLDGIFLDRCRYTDLKSDFSDYSREQFMAYRHLASLKWPDDVLAPGATYTDVNSGQPGVKGPYFKEWLEWRAKVIHDFVEAASNAAHEVAPDIKFGVYVGGWYSQYYDVGVNWASPNYNTASKYSWATANYKNFGYADHCDQMLIGAYASPGAVYGTSEWSMQGFCLQAKDKIGKACKMVAGGPDVGNWDSSDKFSQEEENQAIVNSVKACRDACDGYFLFDMIHLKKADQWQYAKEGIDKALGK